MAGSGKCMPDKNKFMNTSLRLNFRGTDTETQEFISAKAEERGFNRFSRYLCDEVWPKYTQSGITVYESFFYKGNKRLHIIVENDLQKSINDEQYRISLLND